MPVGVYELHVCMLWKKLHMQTHANKLQVRVLWIMYVITQWVGLPHTAALLHAQCRIQ